MRTGYFDSDGKCLVIQTGDMEPPANFAYSAEVPDTLGPNTVEFDKANNKIKSKQKPSKPVPPSPPNLQAQINALEARIAILEAKVP